MSLDQKDLNNEELVNVSFCMQKTPPKNTQQTNPKKHNLRKQKKKGLMGA